MPGPSKPFPKGNPGKPKGTVNRSTAQVREIFALTMSRQIDAIDEAFAKVRETDPAKYLDLVAKLMPYFMPRKVDVTSDGQQLAPIVIDWGDKPTDEENKDGG